MTRDNQENLNFRLCLMLAFQSMIASGKKTETKDAAKRTVELAKRMNEFCNLYVSEASPPATISFVDEVEAAEIDKAIDRHIKELRTKETTCLPEDKKTLVQFYDRLQQRKSRRMLWLFCAKTSGEILADLVLELLDEEI
ncbi:MAG: hypothetical protein P4L53_10905, partial [Candidatus Obscuribacterales bacterium]|nr:hypothetical protein [Candidatus Obscuribacterales bacterium]